MTSPSQQITSSVHEKDWKLPNWEALSEISDISILSTTTDDLQTKRTEFLTTELQRLYKQYIEKCKIINPIPCTHESNQEYQRLKKEIHNLSTQVQSIQSQWKAQSGPKTNEQAMNMHLTMLIHKIQLLISTFYDVGSSLQVHNTTTPSRMLMAGGLDNKMEQSGVEKRWKKWFQCTEEECEIENLKDLEQALAEFVTLIEMEKSRQQNHFESALKQVQEYQRERLQTVVNETLGEIKILRSKYRKKIQSLEEENTKLAQSRDEWKQKAQTIYYNDVKSIEEKLLEYEKTNNQLRQEKRELEIALDAANTPTNESIKKSHAIDNNLHHQALDLQSKLRYEQEKVNQLTRRIQELEGKYKKEHSIREKLEASVKTLQNEKKYLQDQLNLERSKQMGEKVKDDENSQESLQDTAINYKLKTQKDLGMDALERRCQALEKILTKTLEDQKKRIRNPRNAHDSSPLGLNERHGGRFQRSRPHSLIKSRLLPHSFDNSLDNSFMDEGSSLDQTLSTTIDSASPNFSTPSQKRSATPGRKSEFPPVSVIDEENTSVLMPSTPANIQMWTPKHANKDYQTLLDSVRKLQRLTLRESKLTPKSQMSQPESELEPNRAP